MNQKFLCCRNNNGTSYFQLHQRSEDSKWKHSEKEINPLQKLMLSDIQFYNLEKDNQIESVLGVIGVAIGQNPNEQIQLYYLIMLPAQNKDHLNVFWLPFCSSKTKRINNKIQHTILLKMWSNQMNLLNVDNLTEIEKILKLKSRIDRSLVPLQEMEIISLGPNETICKFYVVANHACMVGFRDLKHGARICSAFDKQSFGVDCKEVVLSINQTIIKEKASLKRKQIVDDSLHRIQKTSQAIGDHALYALPAHVAEVAALHKTRFDELLPINDKRFSKHGIRSTIGKNKLPVVPVLGSIHEEVITTKFLSEKHVVSSVENVFQTVYSATDIVSAIDMVIEKCINEYFMNDAETDQVIGAIMSSFYEDLSWRLKAETASPFTFRNIDVDIDQTTLTIKKLNFAQMSRPNEFLRVMYNSLFQQKVFRNKASTFHTIPVNKSKFLNFSTTGGNTYMDGRTRKKFISLCTHGAMDDIFKVSVRILDERSHVEHLDVVWQAMLFVIRFLDGENSNSCVQQRLCLLQLNLPGNTHNVNAGPMFPVLTLLHLATICPCGISVAFETYNGKSRFHKKFVPNIHRTVEMTEVESIVLELSDVLDNSAPFIIERLSIFFQQMALKSFSLNPILDSEIELIYGVGCTIETDLDIIIDVPVSEDIMDVIDDERLHVNERSCVDSFDVNKLAAEMSTVNYTVSIDPEDRCNVSKRGYTVINPSLPSFVENQDNPLSWFTNVTPIDTTDIDNYTDDVDVETTDTDEIDIDDVDNQMSNYDVDIDGNTVCVNNSRISSFPATNDNLDTIRLCQTILAPNIAVSNKFAYTYPNMGGTTHFALQPTTLELKKHSKVTTFKDMISEQIYRIQSYNVSSKLAVGEHDVKMKSSVSSSLFHFDVAGDDKFSIFNTLTCALRQKEFLDYHKITMNEIQHNGSPGRIEIAFGSLSPSNNRTTLINGIRDLLTMCMIHTKSYDTEPIIKMASYSLLGVTSKLDMVYKMMLTGSDTTAIYDEMLSIRTEVAAYVGSWHSGKGKLRHKYLPSPKNSYMACRIILNKMSPLTDIHRQNILIKPTENLFDTFKRKLFDVTGNIHITIQRPEYIPCHNNVDYIQKYICGKACDKCWKTYYNAQLLEGFDTHSCMAVQKGKQINVTDLRYRTQLERDISRLTHVQMELIRQLFDETNSQNNIYLTGYAGTGKSFALVCAIKRWLVEKGMNTFAVISPTKVAAGLVGGRTYHSFLSIDVPGTTFSEDVAGIFHSDTINANRSRLEIRVAAKKHVEDLMKNDRQKDKLIGIKYALKIIFVDECSMLSHDQLYFMDYVMRNIKQQMHLVFGGIRVVLSGDALQLPPIVEKSLTSSERHPVYFFESPSFYNGNFKVLYLKHNHRQTGDIEFIDLLNRLRDGDCTDDDCVVMNNDWGNKVNYESALLTAGTLVTYYESEVEELKKEYDSFISLNPHTTSAYMNFKFATLLNKMKNFWNPEILPQLFDHFYKLSEGTQSNRKHVRQSGNTFGNSQLRKRLKNHFKRLKKSDLVSVNKHPFVICTENNDIFALSVAFASARTAETFSCTSIDKVIDENVQWNSFMDDFALSETKFEKNLVLSIGQSVLFTANDVDPNASNNEIGVIIGVKFDDHGHVEEITISPCLANSLLTPHPIKVTRKKRQLNYQQSAGVTYTITREQFPLKPADGFTPHAAQGVSFSQTYIINNFRNSNKGFGALYVSASRAVHKDLVFFLHPVTKEDFVADPIAKSFDLYHRNKADSLTGLSDVNYYYVNERRITRDTN